MELTYKNVARYVAENEEIDDKQWRLTIEANDVDSYSILYLNLMVFFYQLSKVGFQTNIRYSAEKILIGPQHFKHLIPDDKGFKWKLAQTMHVMSNVDEDYIEEEFNELIYRNKIAINVPLVKECMGEIISNVQSHSGEKVYLMRCDLNEEKGIFDLVIGDVGFGIKTALSEKDDYQDLLNVKDSVAITKAFEKGVTSKQDARGYGLPLIQERILENQECSLFLSSGKGYYMIDHQLSQSPIRCGELQYEMQGVQILMRFEL